MSKNILTQERLKELFRYDAESGYFIRINSGLGRAPLGIVRNRPMDNGYLTLQMDYKSYLQHRLVFLYVEGCFPLNQVDHINHKRADNRWINLAHATASSNQKNRGLSKNNTSSIIGVIKHPCGKWEARIKINRKQICLGFYEDINSAIKIRKKAEKKYGFHPNLGKSLI